MIEFKKQPTKEELYKQQIKEELYKQFTNAIDKGHTYLKIKPIIAKEKFYFDIIKEKDTDDIVVLPYNYKTLEYFMPDCSYFFNNEVLRFKKPVYIPLPKVKGRKTSKKDYSVEFTANTDFIDALNDENSIIEFQTEEEHKVEVLEDKVEELEEKMEFLTHRINDAEFDIKELDEKKSNKFFI